MQHLSLEGNKKIDLRALSNPFFIRSNSLDLHSQSINCFARSWARRQMRENSMLM